ncbi:MAG TPA: hypothetical protein VGJ84_12230, partial [Polyangiaceae bacterium]
MPLHSGPDPPVPVGWQASPGHTAPGSMQVPLPLQSMQHTWPATQTVPPHTSPVLPPDPVAAPPLADAPPLLPPVPVG